MSNNSKRVDYFDKWKQTERKLTLWLSSDSVTKKGVTDYHLSRCLGMWLLWWTIPENPKQGGRRATLTVPYLLQILLCLKTWVMSTPSFIMKITGIYWTLTFVNILQIQYTTALLQIHGAYPSARHWEIKIQYRHSYKHQARVSRIVIVHWISNVTVSYNLSQVEELVR
jgi:hypothetical protein